MYNIIKSNQRREVSPKWAPTVHCQFCDPLNLSTFITSRKMKTYLEWQDEYGDTVFIGAHIPEIETDIFLCTVLNREHHCSPLVHPKFKWTMTYELFYFQDNVTKIYKACCVDRARGYLMLCSISHCGSEGRLGETLSPKPLKMCH